MRNCRHALLRIRREEKCQWQKTDFKSSTWGWCSIFWFDNNKRMFHFFIESILRAHEKVFSFTVLPLYLASRAVLFSIKIIYRKGDCNLFRGAWVIWWSRLGLILTDSAGAHLQLSSPGNMFHILVMFESYWQLVLFTAVNGLWRLLFSYLACLRSFLQSDLETDQLEQFIHTWLHIIIKIMYKKVIQRWSK